MAPSHSTETFYAHGKLLLTGEYAVLDGARGLAVPTRFGQHLQAGYSPEPGVLRWESFDHSPQIWFKAEFSLQNFSIRNTSDQTAAETLQHMLRMVRRDQPTFLRRRQGVHVSTRLEFDRSWGLGSSSTLVSCVARWAGVDPYTLQEAIFGGSGYDVACATAETPIFFQLKPDFKLVRPAPFAPPYADQLLFVHLGRKQNSRLGISTWRNAGAPAEALISRISEISKSLCNAETATECAELIHEHEQLIGSHLGMKRARDLYFEDFPGEIKSLGAWGGDFVLAVSPWEAAEETLAYFQNRGFQDVMPWHEMVL
jgi:mevalonate kinase